MSAAEEHRRVVIVGSGPAGYTAAIYAARAELAPLVVAGLQFGGQLMLTTDVENYPGFPEGVTGPEMMELFQKQAERFGTEVLLEDATAGRSRERPFRIATAEHAFTADAVIVATGATAKWLGLPSEQRLTNRGVSACATCDGALYRGKAMAVVGGGDTAMEEALFLTRFAPRVTVIHRRDELRASKIMQERALAEREDRLRLELRGRRGARRRVRDGRAGRATSRAAERSELPRRGAVRRDRPPAEHGAVPRADRTGRDRLHPREPAATRTSVEGVFACGDAMDPTYRQAVTAAGTGCMAAIDAERWLAEQAVAARRREAERANGLDWRRDGPLKSHKRRSNG